MKVFSSKNMPISRFLFFSSKHRLRQSLSELRSYTKSARQNHGRKNVHPVMPIKTQDPSSWTPYLIPIVVLGFAGAATFVHYNDERRAVPKGQGNKSDCITTEGPIIGGPFTLIDTQKQVVTERDFLGKWVLLYFGYTSSPDVGPEQVQLIAKAIDRLGSKENCKVLPVFVTIDPHRDTPSHLSAYLKEFDSRIVGLTGPVGAIRQMAQEYRVFFRKVEEERDDYLVECSHNMYLINPSMEVVRCFGTEYNEEELTSAIAKQLKKTAS